jgi:outer membrane protein
LKHSLLNSIAAILAILPAAAALAEDAQSRWGLGAAAIVSANPYAGRGTRYSPFPLITYESERVFFQGVSAGVHLYDGDLLEVDLLAKANFGGMDAEDFGRTELARNGINRDLLDDRDDSADVGFNIGLEGNWGEFELQLLADVLDASGGYEASAEYGYPLRFGKRLTVTPKAGINWLSADTANYSYGTLDSEVARGVPRYQPGSVAIPEVGVSIEYNFTGRWLLLSELSYESLPNKVSDSPLLESGSSARLMIGVLRAF